MERWRLVLGSFWGGKSFFFFLGGVLVGQFWFESRIWSTSVGVSCFLLNVPCFEAAESVLIHSVRGQFGTELKFRKSSSHNLGSAGNFCFPQDLFPLQGHFPSWTTDYGRSKGNRIYRGRWPWFFQVQVVLGLEPQYFGFSSCAVLWLAYCATIRACSPKQTLEKLKAKKVGRVKGCHFFRMWRLITASRSWRPIWWRNTLGGSERPWSFWARDVQALPFDMIYSWFALILSQPRLKKGHVFFFFGGQETAVALGSSPDRQIWIWSQPFFSNF